MDSAPLRFGPDRRLTSAALGVAVLVGVAAVATDDPRGRFLSGGAAVLLAVWAATDLAFWPRLTVGGAGLQLRTPTVRVVVPWAAAELRVDVRTRFGLASRTLEIDAGPHLVVLSRLALGRDPREAYALIEGRRPGP